LAAPGAGALPNAKFRPTGNYLTVLRIISNTVYMNELDAIAARLRTVVRLLIRRAYTAVGEKGPARSEQGVMAWLDEKGALTPKGLADLEKVRPQTMGQTLDSLARRRWIQRAPHPSDRRQILISLSPAGQTALIRARYLRQAWLVEELEKLKPAERKALTAALEILDRIAHS
jgi:DNA-binding MarR family transcriptional regulator